MKLAHISDPVYASYLAHKPQVVTEPRIGTVLVSHFPFRMLMSRELLQFPREGVLNRKFRKVLIMTSDGQLAIYHVRHRFHLQHMVGRQVMYGLQRVELHK